MSLLIGISILRLQTLTIGRRSITIASTVAKNGTISTGYFGLFRSGKSQPFGHLDSFPMLVANRITLLAGNASMNLIASWTRRPAYCTCGLLNTPHRPMDHK